jgi:hypothetical protein
MTHAECAKGFCEGVAAIAAIVAAISWRSAARKPVAKYAGTGYGGVSPNLPINEEIERGAALNARAATWAAVSAFFQASALLIGIAWH